MLLFPYRHLLATVVLVVGVLYVRGGAELLYNLAACAFAVFLVTVLPVAIVRRGRR
jgi:uncharacterized membrane protein